jgi:predicted dehydrogenase
VPASNRRIGIIGVGFGAQVYIPGLRSEGWEVAAVCSRSREKAAKTAEAANKNGGMATMSSSLAATPARGAKIVVMGDNGTLIAEHAGPNPMENGAVIGGRNGLPLQELETPKKYTPFTDARDHRLMAFRLLVRDFAARIERGASPAPNFTDGLRCQEVLDAVRESSESGRTVKLA